VTDVTVTLSPGYCHIIIQFVYFVFNCLYTLMVNTFQYKLAPYKTDGRLFASEVSAYFEVT